MADAGDYYATLGVARGATQDEIKSAYRRLARELHPDVNKAADAAAKFSRLQEAYEVLSDETKRSNYDRFGVADPASSGPSGPGGRRGTYTWTNVGGRPSQGQGDFTDFDIGSMFEEVFGRQEPFNTSGPSSRSRGRAQRGKDIEHEIVIDFLEAVRGGARSMRVKRGSETQTIEVTIPAGVDEGTKLRMRGAGMPGSGHAPPGDLIVTVRIAPHAIFRREGFDVIFDLPLTIAEAALGASIRIPTLTGRAEITVPPGTSSGQRLRLKGQGIRGGSTQGDLLAVAKIVAPRELSEQDKAALRALADRLPPARAGAPWE